MNTYTFGYIPIHDEKPGTFKLKSASLAQALYKARLLNPDAVLISEIIETPLMKDEGLTLPINGWMD